MKFPVTLEHPDLDDTTVAHSRTSLRVMQARGWRPVDHSPDLDSMKRTELDEYAATVGVVEPEKLPNIQAVKDAIAAATAAESDTDAQDSGQDTEA